VRFGRVSFILRRPVAFLRGGLFLSLPSALRFQDRRRLACRVRFAVLQHDLAREFEGGGFGHAVALRHQSVNHTL
jgi:hypothetical protein